MQKATPMNHNEAWGNVEHCQLLTGLYHLMTFLLMPSQQYQSAKVFSKTATFLYLTKHPT